ncbi:MAG: glycosyltransferase family 4 protein [Planctomycetota bacterium]
MLRALEAEGVDVVALGPLAPPIQWPLKALNHLTRRLGTPVVSSAHSLVLARSYARRVEERLRGERLDAIFAPAASALTSFLRTEVPIVYTSDATFTLMADYYPEFSRLARWSRRAGEVIEQRAIDAAASCVFPSRWAADSAIRDYGAATDRVHVAEYGANIESPPSADQVDAHRSPSTCRLLFVGVSWSRKGGAIALDALRSLRRRGIDADLTICGCEPPSGEALDGVTVIPFLDKNDPREHARLEQLYLDSDYFVLPTRREAYGIASCEANAFGLPAITTETGGVPSVVRDGDNGFLLPLEAGGEAYADVIERLHRDPEAYVVRARAARAAFDERLNWTTWGHAIVDRIRDAIEAR